MMMNTTITKPAAPPATPAVHLAELIRKNSDLKRQLGLPPTPTFASQIRAAHDRVEVLSDHARLAGLTIGPWDKRERKCCTAILASGLARVAQLEEMLRPSDIQARLATALAAQKRAEISRRADQVIAQADEVIAKNEARQAKEAASRPAPPKSRAEIKAALWEQYKLLSPAAKNQFFAQHRGEMDI